MTITYTCKPFDVLDVHELYDIMRLRQEVFVVEQDCPYLDADGKDMFGHHLMGQDEGGRLHAYTRLLPVGVSYDGYCSIGRVITSIDVRSKGEGKILMHQSISKIKSLYPDVPIKIGAQAHLKHFYERLGFTDIGIPYLEDNIPHIIMTME